MIFIYILFSSTTRKIMRPNLARQVRSTINHNKDQKIIDTDNIHRHRSGDRCGSRDEQTKPDCLVFEIRPIYNQLPYEDNVISFLMSERLTFAYSACKNQCREVCVTSPITNASVRLFSKFGDAILISLGLLISIAYIRLWKSCHIQSAPNLRTDTVKMRCDEERQTEGKVRDFMVGTTSLARKCSYLPRLKQSKCPKYIIFTAS